MIRILHILPSIQVCGGIQAYLMNYYKNMDCENIQFDFYTLNTTPPSYKEEIEKMGGRVFVADVADLKKSRAAYNSFLHFLEEHEEYKIIHCHMANSAFIYLRAAEKRGAPNRILHSHQNKAADIASHVIRNIPLIYWGKRYCNQRLACSQSAGDWLFRGKDYTIIRNAIEIDRFVFNSQNREELRRDMDEKTLVIGFVGRLCAQKNVRFALDIMHELTIKNIPYEFWIIGDGEQQEMLEKQCQTLNISDRVKFMGEQREVEKYYSAMDVFLLPSLYEGLGIVNIEAQTNGLHCIVSDRIPKEAMVTDLIETVSLKESAAVWADRITQYADGYERKNMREEIIQAGYDVANEAKKFEDFYRGLSVENQN